MIGNTECYRLGLEKNLGPEPEKSLLSVGIYVHFGRAWQLLKVDLVARLCHSTEVLLEGVFRAAKFGLRG